MFLFCFKDPCVLCREIELSAYMELSHCSESSL
jgi:hypothetical protein